MRTFRTIMMPEMRAYIEKYFLAMLMCFVIGSLIANLVAIIAFDVNVIEHLGILDPNSTLQTF